MLIQTLAHGPRYLIRFDDICPTLCWDIWNEIELVLRTFDIRPMLAVVPDNQDPGLVRGPASSEFWQRVRYWQSIGWTIGLHGYQHRYVTKSQGIVGLNRYSEFADLPFEEQYQKLRAAMMIFQREQIEADIWIAPAHTFDSQTLRALQEIGLRTISDGFNLWPHTDESGMFWIPQQLGRFHSMPAGIWTVCLHLDDPLHADVQSFRNNIEKFRKYIVDVPTIQALYRDSKEAPLNLLTGKLLRWAKMLNLRRVNRRVGGVVHAPRV